MARRRSGRRRSKRVCRRDARGRFPPTGSVASDEKQAKRKRRRRAAVAGSAVAVGAAVIRRADVIRNFRREVCEKELSA